MALTRSYISKTRAIHKFSGSVDVVIAICYNTYTIERVDIRTSRGSESDTRASTRGYIGPNTNPMKAVETEFSMAEFTRQMSRFITNAQAIPKLK